jgi:RNA polymerase sigma factor (sigma-70 family)
LLTEEIIQGCLANDRRSQRLLYEHCYPIMMRICKRYTINEDEAVESMNTSFLKILKKLDTVKDMDSIHSWIKQITINTSIDFYRSKKRHTERNKLTVDNEYSNVENTNFILDFTESKMDSKEIYKMIQELPNTTREVLNLFAIDGFSHKEVADMLSISEENSRWHLHKARKLMTEKLSHSTYSLNIR